MFVGVLWGTFGAINQLNNGYRPTSNKSYATYSLSTTFKTLVFSVRTRSISGLILQLKYNDSVFMSVETDSDGFLRLRNHNVYSPRNEGSKITDAIPHLIQINNTAIKIDNKAYDIPVTFLPVRAVFIGGLPVANDEIASSHAQFRGCINDVRLNGKQLLFFNQTADELNSTQLNIFGGCSGEDVCTNVSGTTVNFVLYNDCYCTKK